MKKGKKILKNLPPHSLAAIGSFSWFYCQEGEMVPFFLPKTLQLQNHDWGMIFKLKPWEKREKKKKWDSLLCNLLLNFWPSFPTFLLLFTFQSSKWWLVVFCAEFPLYQWQRQATVGLLHLGCPWKY